MKKVLGIIVLSLFLNGNSYANAKEYKAYMCNWYTASTIFLDDCNGTNSWYKVYFPDTHPNKDLCMRDSNSIFNSPLIMEMFPDYKKLGDEMKAWVAGCDNLWRF